MAAILILGATSPICRKLALRFALEGAKLFLAARDLDEIERVAADIRVRSGAQVFAGTFDACDFSSHAGLISAATEKLGRLEGLVLGVGALGNERLAKREVSEAISVINANYSGAVSILTLAAAELESAKHGFIIVIGSVAGDRGRQGNYVYGSAKGGLALFAQGLRAKLAKSSVHVLTVKPGYVDTRMTWGRPGVFLCADPDKVAARIHRALGRRKDVIYVPSFWRPIMMVVRAIPERAFKRLSL
jgi:short-subunit dehydrogenase